MKSLLIFLDAVHDVVGDCAYYLTEQPSNTMTCNPYPSGKFFTRCVVEFSSTSGAPLRLAWFSRAKLGGSPQRIFSGFITKNTMVSVESELTITMKDTATSRDGFSGFFCQVSFFNGTILAKSQEIYLFPQYAFSNTLKKCDDQSMQSSHLTKCVDPNLSTEVLATSSSVPMTTSPTLQPMTNPSSEQTSLPQTSTSSSATTGPSSTTPLATTSSSPPAPQVVSAPSALPQSGSSLPLPFKMEPNSRNEVSTESEIGTGSSFDDEALLFLTLGAAVFLLILIASILFCCCLWSDQCRQCGYELCCSGELCCACCSCCLCLDDV